MGYLEHFYNFVEKMGKTTEVLKPPIQNSTDIFLLAGVASMVSTSESIVLLLKNGYQVQCDVLIRSLSEISIHTHNVAYLGQEYIDRMMLNSLTSEVSKINFCIKNFTGDKLDYDKLKKFIIDYEVKIKAIQEKRQWKFKETSIYESFVISGEVKQYISYKQLCNRAHSSLTTLTKDHVSEVRDGFVDINKPLATKEIYISLCLASEMMLLAFESALDYFSVETDLCKEALNHYGAMKNELRIAGEAE